MERIIPDVMKPEPTVTETAKTEETAQVKETARFENMNEGLCPSCRQQMRLSVANGIPVHVCMEHSVVMPLRDSEPI